MKRNNDSIDNLKKVFAIMFSLKRSKRTEIYDSIKEQNEISKMTIYRKLEKLVEFGFLKKNYGRPIIYELVPIIDMIILELKSKYESDLKVIAEEYSIEFPKLLKIIRDLDYYGIINGEIVTNPRNSKIIFKPKEN